MFIKEYLHTFYLLCMCIFSSFAIIGFAIFAYQNIFIEPSFIDARIYDYKGRISCESDSMGLSLKCNQKTKGEIVQPNDKLIIGDIYTFNGQKANQYYQNGTPYNSSSVVHRLVACLDPDCNISIFKGDNNLGAEFVPREYIIARIVSIES